MKTYIEDFDKTYREMLLEQEAYAFDYDISYDDFDFKSLNKYHNNVGFLLNNYKIWDDDLDYFSEKRHILSLEFENIVVRFCNDKHIKQPEICRVYITILKPDYRIIPVLVSDNTHIPNLECIGLPRSYTNELACFLSHYHTVIKNYMFNGNDDNFSELKMLQNLIRFDSIIKSDISEAWTMPPEYSGLISYNIDRCLWIDENRNTNHWARIKVQHTTDTNTNHWASIDAFPPYKIKSGTDADKTGKVCLKKAIEFIQKNEKLINDVFDSKQPDKDINYFKANYVPIGNITNPFKKEENINIISHFYNVGDNIIIVIRDDKKMNAKRDGILLLDKWVDSISYNPYDKILNVFDGGHHSEMKT